MHGLYSHKAHKVNLSHPLCLVNYRYNLKPNSLDLVLDGLLLEAEEVALADDEAFTFVLGGMELES